MSLYFENGNPVPTAEFDYDALDAAPPEPSSTPAGTETLEAVLRILATPAAIQYFGQTHARKVIALGWVGCPQRYEGKSLAELARETGVTPQAMSRYSALASRLFGLRNRSQRAHGGRWKRRAGQPAR